MGSLLRCRGSDYPSMTPRLHVFQKAHFVVALMLYRALTNYAPLQCYLFDVLLLTDAYWRSLESRRA